MKTFHVAVSAPRGTLLATCSAEDNIPTGLVLQAVMSHRELVPHLSAIDANQADTLLIGTGELPVGASVPPGLTVAWSDGVSVSGPMHPSPIAPVPPQFHGVQLTAGLRALVTYRGPSSED